MEPEKIAPQIFILTLVTFAVGTETYVFSGLLIRLANDLHISVATAGQLSASFAIAYAVAAPFTAGFASRFERKRVLIVALLGLAIINFLASVMPNFTDLLIVRIVGGVIASLITPVASASASTLVSEKQRGKALALVLGGLTLSLVVGVPIGSLIGGLFNWRSTFVFSGLLISLAAIGVMMILPFVPDNDTRGARSFAIVKRSAVSGNLVLTMFGMMATLTLLAYVSPIAKIVAAIEGSRVGLVQFTVGIGSILGIIIGGKSADKKHAQSFVKSAFTVIAIALIMVSLLMLGIIDFGRSGNTFLLISMVLANAVALFALAPIIQTRLIKAAPNTRNVVFALNGSMIFFGQGLGAAFGGGVIATAGLPWLGIAGSFLALLGLTMAYAISEVPVTVSEEPATLRIV